MEKRKGRHPLGGQERSREMVPRRPQHHPNVSTSPTLLILQGKKLEILILERKNEHTRNITRHQTVHQ